MRTTSTRTTQVVGALRAAGCVWAEEEAELLIAHASGVDDLSTAVAARVRGEPLELILGWAAFRGLRIPVRPHVFIPRRRTEFLAAEAISLVRAIERPVVLDLCCGAGAISAAVLHEIDGEITLWAGDLDPIAVELTRGILDRYGDGRAVGVGTGDLFEPLPRSLRGRVDVLVANVPYVPTGQIPLLPNESRMHEPVLTLDGGDDGLAVFRRLLAGAREWLAPGGRVLSEVGRAQVDLARTALTEHGLRAQIHRRDDVDAHVAIGRCPP